MIKIMRIKKDISATKSVVPNKLPVKNRDLIIIKKLKREAETEIKK